VSCGSAWQRLPVAIPDTLRLFLVRSVDGCFQLDFDCCENGVLRSRRFPRGLLLEGWLADRTGKTLSSADRSQVIARADDRSVRRAASDESGVAITAGNQRSRIISNTVKRNCSRQWASVSQTIQATARPVRTPRHVAGKARARRRPTDARVRCWRRRLRSDCADRPVRAQGKGEMASDRPMWKQ
jgi:hypothetical protein